MRVVAFRLLGGFAASDSEGRPIAIPSRKCRALLAYLALESGPASREKLADLFWGNCPDDLARQSLRQCLVGLRKIFRPHAPDLVVTTHEGVGLRHDLISVDALEFLRLAEIREYDRAAELYAGELLESIGLESTPIAEWIDSRRNHFATVAARVLERSAQMWEARGDSNRAISAAERLIEVDAFREDWQRMLLQLYARYLGRQRALGHARKLTHLLRRELEVEPEPATLELVSRIQRGVTPPSTVLTPQPSEYSI